MSLWPKRFSPHLSLLTLVLPAAAWAEFRLATFSADITVPIGHGMMGGSWKATQVVDPLFAPGSEEKLKTAIRAAVAK